MERAQQLGHYLNIDAKRIELEEEELLEELEAAEKKLGLEDWQYLYRHAHGPEKKRIHDRIAEMGGKIDTDGKI